MNGLFLAIGIAVAGLAIAIGISRSGDRYEIVAVPPYQAWKLDKWSGKLSFCRRGRTSITCKTTLR